MTKTNEGYLYDMYPSATAAFCVQISPFLVFIRPNDYKEHGSIQYGFIKILLSVVTPSRPQRVV